MTGFDNPDTTMPEVVARRLRNGRSQQSPRLTIVYHPQLERIGDVADLPPYGAQEAFELGRLQPLFRNLRSGAAAALDDAHISRTTVEFHRVAAGVEIVTPVGGNSLRVNGAHVRGRTRLDQASLRAGVPILLARRIVLYLSYCGCPQVSPHSYGLVGESDAVENLRSMITAAGETDIPVLLLGASGTGKELVAQAIHGISSRRQRAMIAVNMAAIPTELAAAELFGVSKGAYTGADTDRDGYFLAAAGSTLFLDEIGACPAKVQPQLLRALQSGHIQIPGGRQRRTDVRLISATDADLSGAHVKFSNALRHRLSGLEILLSPLSDRREDIGRLLRHFLREFESERGQPAYFGDRDPVEAARWAALIGKFLDYEWPGNIRELRNFCRQIAIVRLAQGELCLSDNMLSALRVGSPAESAANPARNRLVSELSDEEIIVAMRAERFEPAAASRRLDVSRPTLYKRLESIPGLRLVGEIPLAEINDVYRRCKGALRQAAEHLEVSATALARRWRALDLEARPDQ